MDKVRAREPATRLTAVRVVCCCVSRRKAAVLDSEKLHVTLFFGRMSTQTERPSFAQRNTESCHAPACSQQQPKDQNNPQISSNVLVTKALGTMTSMSIPGTKRHSTRSDRTLLARTILRLPPEVTSQSERFQDVQNFCNQPSRAKRLSNPKEPSHSPTFTKCRFSPPQALCLLQEVKPKPEKERHASVA